MCVSANKTGGNAPRQLDAGQELNEQGIHIAAASRATVDEEFSGAYKDVTNVVDVVHGAKLAIKVAKLRPVGVIKG